MKMDFSKMSVEYNWGFIDGLIWMIRTGNKAELVEILSMIENISKINNEIMEEEYKRIGRMEIRS